MPNSLRLFRVFGITVYLHWAWLLVAIYQINYRAHEYSSLAWNVAVYLTLFLIVLLHEFGHSLACRQVGGVADRILLWPLGGVAYVSPPQRPGAVLWSIAAGPLVNVVLLVIFFVLAVLGHMAHWAGSMPDLARYIDTVWLINLWLLRFNLLPIYPLDGGQILRALLWFLMGPVRSMYVAVGLGFVGVAGLALWAYKEQSLWIGIIAYFVFMNCLSGLAQAKALKVVENLPRRTGFSCPSCGIAPPIGAFWSCQKCGTKFDTFQTQAVCPNCRAEFPTTLCIGCRTSHPMATWRPLPSGGPGNA